MINEYMSRAERGDVNGPGIEALENAGSQLPPLSRWGTAREVASLVAYLLSDESQFITGSIMTCDEGWCETEV
jgi:NAD(P)-dependent dehydrogenase (short-subunit alcohol dehydrogenase family)